MAPRVTRIKEFFAPPVFPDDEDKTRTANVLNTLLMIIMLFLIILGVVALFVFVEKLYNLVIILLLFLAVAVARWQLQRGRVRFASVLWVSVSWVVFTVFLLFAGGMTSIAAVFYVAITVVAGLLLGTRAALISALACILTGLGMVILESSSHPPKRIFPIPALVGWVDLTLGLLLTTTVLNLVLHSLNDALALARGQIEERKKAEGALRQRERDFSTLVENATDMIVRFDADLRHVYCNPAVEKHLGVPVQMFLGKTPLELGEGEPSEQAEFIDRSLKRTLETGKEQQVEQSYPTPFGLKHFQTRIVPELGPSGRIESLLAISRDITERKQAEEALREREALYRSLVETSPTAIVTGDIQGDIIFANSYLAQMHGYENVDELLSEIKNIRELVAPESQMLLEQEFKVVMETGYSPIKEYTLPKKGGEKFPAMVSATAIRDSEGKPTGFLAIALDITERKQAEEERARLTTQIHEQARQMEQILATVPEGVLLLDAEGRVLQANPVAEGDLATLARAQVGDVLAHLGDRPLTELLISPPTRGLWHEVKADKRTFEVIARPVENGPKPEHWVLVVNDVTRERESRAQLQQQERLAAVGQLAAGIAHDFNNIMAVIVLYTQMGLSTPGIPPKLRERLQTVSQQARRATDLIQQILDFSRRSVLERRPMDLTPFLKEVVKLLERTMPESIKLDLSYGRDEYTVNADPTRMQQAILNLAVNARDAMLPKGGGELHIGLSRTAATDEIRCVSCGQVLGGEWVRITVTDTGGGIPSDALPHIFEPFFTTKEIGKGTGLGLAQVYGIVKQHEGHIDVTTRAGEGTTFSVYLPVLLAHQPEAPAVEADAFVQGQGETILVVEDDAALRKALVEGLKSLNYRVLEAAHGREALAILEQQTGDPSTRHRGEPVEPSGQKVSLVLSDLVMPEMGGQALFHAMQQRGLTLPLVMLSGHPMESELESLQAQGLAGWMLKPPNVEQLAQLLARVLRKASE